MPNQDVPFPPGFDYAVVTVAVDGLLVRFIRGREELDVRVAAIDAPTEWHDLPLLVSLMRNDEELQRQSPRNLQEAARLLALEIDNLTLAFAGDARKELKQRLDRVYADDRIAMREAEWAINKRLR